MRIVADSSPLIAFAILNQLDLLSKMFSGICVPQGVYDEISAWSKPYSQKLRKILKNKVKAVRNRLAVQLLRKDMNPGEAEAIVLALEEGIENILIDDHKGRKIAQAQGLHPFGSIGVLLQAKKVGLSKK